MKVLVIGGTADGRYLASALYELGFDVIYSIAGIVRKATLPCPVIAGGFTQFGGLQKYVTDNQVTHLVDATHPFAEKMSNKISLVSEALFVPCIRFHRQQWQKTNKDSWVEVLEWDEVILKMAKYQSIFITAGQITQQVVDALSKQCKHVLLRTAMPVKIVLPDNVTWIKAIGPFQLEHEKTLIEEYNIEAIISKNSGGESTYAKIKAAAEAGICVYQFKRPMLKPVTFECDNQINCISLLQEFKADINNEI